MGGVRTAARTPWRGRGPDQQIAPRPVRTDCRAARGGECPAGATLRLGSQQRPQPRRRLLAPTRARPSIATPASCPGRRREDLEQVTIGDRRAVVTGPPGRGLGSERSEAIEAIEDSRWTSMAQWTTQECCALRTTSPTPITCSPAGVRPNRRRDTHHVRRALPHCAEPAQASEQDRGEGIASETSSYLMARRHASPVARGLAVVTVTLVGVEIRANAGNVPATGSS